MAYIKNPIQAISYCKFRPSPPTDLVEKIISFLKEEIEGPLRVALDVGCGSGQSTKILAPYFKQVIGVDSSKEQLHYAEQNCKYKNVAFRLGTAEDLKEPGGSVDLVTAGMALHWFDLNRFSTEVGRVLRPSGALAVYGYSIPRPVAAGTSLAEVVKSMIGSALGQFFPDESRLVYFEGYKGHQFSKFPFSKHPSFRFEFQSVKKNASINDFVGYISTMSAFHNYMAKHGEEKAQILLSDLKSIIKKELSAHADDEELHFDIVFPYFLLLSRKDI